MRNQFFLRVALTFFIATSAAPADAAYIVLPQGTSGDEALVTRFNNLPAREIPTPKDWWYQRYHFHHDADVIHDLKNRRALMNLGYIKSHVIPELNRLNLTPDEMYLEVNGGKAQGGQDLPVPMSTLNAEKPYFIFPTGPEHLQEYVRIALKHKGKLVHVMDNSIMEKLTFPKIEPKAYEKYPEVALGLPEYLTRKASFDPWMVELSSQIQHRNVVWGVAQDSKNKELQKAFEEHGSDLKPMPKLDEHGEIAAWEIRIPGKSKPLVAGRADIATRGGAAFNQHSFFWDDHFVAIARATTDSQISLDTLVYWLNAQQSDGAIGRELDFKGTPYHRFIDVKYGHSAPNYEFYNPPLTGWAWREVLRWTPTQSAPHLARAIEVSRKQREWFLREVGVFGPDKKLVGFYWSNHGSGRDNAPRPLDELGIEAYPKYKTKANVAPGRLKKGLAVDLLAQYKIMLDSEAEMSRILGRFADADKAQAEAAQIAQLLQTRYYNSKLGWYTDLIPVGKTDWAQANVVTLGGFWPVAAKVAPRDQIAKMIKNYLENPKKFGGPILSSLPKDQPYYDEGGHYWRGGGWPPDWEMVARALFENGFRTEASRVIERSMAAITSASESYAAGDTPELMFNWVDAKQSDDPNGYAKVKAKISQYFKKFYAGEIKNPKPTGRGNIYEFYGIRRDAENRPVPIYGQEIIEDGGNRMHLTRSGFAGWGAVVPLRSAHYFAGLDAVPQFRGADEDLGKWLYQVFASPEFSHHQVRNIPAFKNLAQGFASGKAPSMAEFESRLKAQKSPEFAAQLAFLKKGYIEISPMFDPSQGQTVLKNYQYDGQHFELKIDHRPNGEIALTARSEKPLRLQFNSNWTGRGQDSQSSNQANFSSPIVEVGGTKPTVVLSAVCKTPECAPGANDSSSIEQRGLSSEE